MRGRFAEPATGSERGLTLAEADPAEAERTLCQDPRMDYTALLGDANSCDVSDACDRLGLPAARSGGIRPVYPGCPVIAGRIITLTLAPGHGTALGDLVDALADAAPVGAEVAFVDLAGRTDLQCWGTVLATAARLHGIRAAVVDGAVRDVDGLAGIGFPTAARGVHPAALRGRLELVGTGRDVVVDGVRVPSGWVVVADVNGVVCIDAAHAEQVLGTAAELARAERDLLRRVGTTGDPARSLQLLRDR